MSVVDDEGRKWVRENCRALVSKGDRTGKVIWLIEEGHIFDFWKGEVMS